MKLKFLSILAVLIIATFSLTACNVVQSKEYQATGEEYFEFVEREDDGLYAITVKEGVTLPEKIKLPVEHDGVEVVEILARAFKNNAEIKQVIVPVGYSIIGAEAFAYCKNLSTVTVGQHGGGESRDLTVRASAFQGCTALSSLTLGATVKVIDAYAFYETAVSALNFAKVTAIGANAFGSCAHLKSFYVPASLISIDDNAFKGSTVQFTVAESNPVYDSENGNLIKK